MVQIKLDLCHVADGPLDELSTVVFLPNCCKGGGEGISHSSAAVCVVRIPALSEGIPPSSLPPSFIPFDPFEKVLGKGRRGRKKKNQTELKIAEPFLIRRRLCRCRIMYTSTVGFNSCEVIDES